MRKSEQQKRESMIGQAYHLIHERKEYEEGRQLALKARAELFGLGQRSAYVEWLLAIAYDFLGKFAEAFTHIEEARAMDPLDPQYIRSLQIIVARARAALLATDAPLQEVDAGRLYQLLMEAEEADLDCHLAMAARHQGAGRHPEALRLYEAVTILHSNSSQAWEGLASCARALEDHTLAEKAIQSARACSVKLPAQARRIEG